MVPNTKQGTVLSALSTDQPADPELTFLTRNTLKAGANNPSIADIITVLDQNKLAFLILTETPLYLHSGALTKALRNRGYFLHYHPSSASSQHDVLT